MINVILQFLELHLVNINVSAKFNQNIPNSLRVKFNFFSEFEPRQNLNQSQMSFDYLMGYTMSISICMQNFITILHSVQEIGPFSLFRLIPLKLGTCFCYGLEMCMWFGYNPAGNFYHFVYILNCHFSGSNTIIVYRQQASLVFICPLTVGTWRWHLSAMDTFLVKTAVLS